MKTLGRLLGSTARTEVLRALHYQPGPIGVRHAARIAEVNLRSAQLALEGLVAEGLVRRSQGSPRPVYEIDRHLPEASLLADVFEAAARATTRARNQSLVARGRAILPSMAEAGRMVSQARRSRRVT